MQHVDQPLWTWCIGKPICVGLAAIQVATSAKHVCELLRFVRREEGSFALPRLFSITEWSECYRNSIDNSLTAMSFLPVSSESELSPAARFRFLKRQVVAHMQSMQKGKIRDAISAVKEGEIEFLLAELHLWLRDSIKKLDQEFQNQSDKDDVSAMIENVKCRFYLEVTFPAILEYQETPEILLAKAIDRDWDALEKLCRIDKWVTRIPEIYRLEDSGNTADARAYEIATKPTKERPPAGQLDESKVKLVLAALLSHSADLVGHRLSAKDIRELFDIVAKRYNGQTRDIDLNPDDLNLAKAIQRHKKTWQTLHPLPPAEALAPLKEFRKQRASALKKHQRRKSA